MTLLWGEWSFETNIKEQLIEETLAVVRNLSPEGS